MTRRIRLIIDEVTFLAAQYESTIQTFHMMIDDACDGPAQIPIWMAIYSARRICCEIEIELQQIL